MAKVHDKPTLDRARTIWEAHSAPSARIVAKLMIDEGFNVSSVTIARWRRQGWRNGDLTRSHCKRGHPLIGDNIQTLKYGNRIVRLCRTCRRPGVKAVYKRWRDSQRAKGLFYGGYTKGNISRTVNHQHVEKMFEAVRATGLIKATYSILTPAKVSAFLFFNPKIRDELKEAAALARPEGAIITAPMIVRSPVLVELAIARINQAVPRHLSKDHRDDTISDMTLAWLEGLLRTEDIERRAREFVGKRFKTDHNKWGDLSLDVPIYDDGMTTLGDTITRGLWD